MAVGMCVRSDAVERGGVEWMFTCSYRWRGRPHQCTAWRCVIFWCQRLARFREAVMRAMNHGVNLVWIYHMLLLNVKVASHGSV